MISKIFMLPLSFAAFVLLTACSEEKTQSKMTLANPASTNCVNKGGKLQIVKRGDGGEYGVCYFEDNRQCEEWALYRGECPEGGLKVTGYTTPEGTYCAITGGTPENQEKQCKLPGGKLCDAIKYYSGSC